MAYTGEKYVGDLALYYIAKKLESGKTTGTVKEAISKNDINKQLKGDFVGAEPTPGATLGLPYNQPQGRATVFTQEEINTALSIADRLFESYRSETPKGFTEIDLYESAQIESKKISNIEENVKQFAGPNDVTFDFAPNKPAEVVIKDSKGAKDPVYTGITFDFAPGRDPKDVIAEAQVAVELGVPASFDVPQTTVEEMGFTPGTPSDPTPIIPDNGDNGDDGDDGDDGGPQEQVINPNKNVFNNIPDGADLVDVEGQLFLRYAVPGAGELYEGSTLFMFYEVRYNDPIKAGFVTPGQEYYINAKFSNDDLDLMGVVAGNSADLPRNGPDGVPLHPFTSFVETISTEATIKPWILDPDSVSLLAEAALENREVTEAEWFGTNWYDEHTESERNWLREYYKDPGTATQKANDYKIQVASALKAAGVSGGYDTESNQELGAPDALSTWIANKWVTGSWSESYTTEQLALFADPFRTGVRDSDFTQYINTAGLGGLNRSAEQEDRIQKLYTQYLGPVFGGLTDTEIAEKAGRLRNNPDYEQALIESLKTSRLALFPKYTNPELTYDDIVTPWRGLTRQTWGQEADETQGWWQDMVATNDYEAGQELLRTKGLEQDIGQVTVEATQALQQALGGAAGSVETRLGVNE